MSKEQIVGGPDMSGEIDPKHMDKEARGISRRALLVGGLGAFLGGIGVATGVYGALKASQINDLERRLTGNELADCLNENVLRQALGFGQADYSTCKTGRNMLEEKIGDEYRKAPTNTPFPTRTPTVGPQS